MRKLLLVLMFPALISGCKTTTMVSDKAIDVNDMDTTVSPGENFYRYANGGWLVNNPLTDEYSRYGSFDKLQEDNNEQVKTIIERLSSETPEDESEQRAGRFYTQGMDSATLEQQGTDALNKYFALIDSIDNYNSAMKVITELHSMGISPFFSTYATPDKKNSDWNIIGIWQGSLGMNDRDYYLNDDDRTLEIQEAYKTYVARLFELTGTEFEESKIMASAIFTFEQNIAEASMSRLQMRDPKLTYNKMDLAGLNELSSLLQWENYFTALKVESKNDITVGQTEYMQFITAYLKSTDIDLLKKYLKFYLTSSSAPYLSNDFTAASFNFYGKVMQGKEQNKPRWKRIVAYTNNAVGEALGKAYVTEYFPPESKVRMEQLVSNLIAAFGTRIDKLDWMTDTTKAEAQEKLSQVNVKIGYPNKWRDYSELSFDSEYFLHNVIEARAFNKAYNLAKVGKQVDPEEWLMLPHTVNAYYHPLYNEIVFPAAILQPPFFFADADDAVNYGAIGVVIGHEITHGFDDKGRMYDKNGVLNDWWTATDSKQFDEKTQKLVEQFNSFHVKDNVYANGALTLGENIADLGGLHISFAALKATDDYSSEAVIDGFTADQRFFLAYAHLWANNIRNEEMLRRVKEDVHSLGVHRVNGPLKNIGEFYKAFNITENDSMYLATEQRAVIW